LPYLNAEQLNNLGLKSIGSNVRISDRAAIYNPEQLEIGDNSRIDDFCVVSGNVKIGRNIHITIFCNVAGGSEGIVFQDFSTLAYAAHVFTQSDDYSGVTMTNSTVPAEYKNETKMAINIGKHSIIGARSVIFPGVTLGEGTSIGAMSLVTKSTQPWSIYFGVPARRIKDRSRDLLQLEQKYIDKYG